jgi:hypothetical protein
MIHGLINAMKVTEILNGWKSILAGRAPFLSIELTKECPLSCPGCYAYGDEHLGGNVLLTQVSDFKGKELVDRFMQLVDRHQPLRLGVGGEPLVRFRELNDILPQLAARGIVIQLVTSAVHGFRSMGRNAKLTIVVSIDGPFPNMTYGASLRHTSGFLAYRGHRITVHCTITRQMTERPGYLREFMDFWSARPETEKVWFSMFTPQVGETSYEILPPQARAQVVKELHEIRAFCPKLSMTPMTINGFLEPPQKPSDCIFANTTRTFTADLKTQVGPCQFGGNPDCSQCGCIASAGLNSIGRVKLAGIRIARIYEQSFRIGNTIAAMRGD